MQAAREDAQCLTVTCSGPADLSNVQVQNTRWLITTSMLPT